MRRLEYPMLWLSQVSRAHYTSPWKHFPVDGILLNAYDFMQHPVLFKEVKEKRVHKFLDYDGPVIMDSGGFLFMKKKKMDVSAKKIIDFYEESKPNFGVVLDHPVTPALSYKESTRRKLHTLRNTRTMMNNRITKNPVLVPVIHGYEPKEIRWYLKKLAKIDSFPIYGIGSLVPSLYNVKGIGGILNVVKVISEVRKQIPDARLHVFGTGGTLTMHLMFYAGADSLDSSAWRTKAAFGAIQMAGMGDRWITKVVRKKPYPQLSKEEKRKLENCRCPACKNDGFRGLQKSFSSRALHNAWVHQQEVRKARKLIKANRYEEYVSKIMKKTLFSNLFSTIQQWKYENEMK